MPEDVKSLEVHGVIGFDGLVLKGLNVHPDGNHIVYPIGNKVCIQEYKSKKMYFLSGHTNTVSAVAVAPKGTYVGSGQITHIGFKASTNLWDFKKKTLIGSHTLHKVRVEAITFTSDDRYMVSLGGRDDGCVVLWDCEASAAKANVAAVRLTTGDATTLGPLSLRGCSFVTGGDCNLRVWNIRPENKTLDVVDVSLGKLRRTVRSIAVSHDDTYGYAGTATGDIIKFSINYPADPMVPVGGCKPALIGCFAKCGPFVKGRKPSTVCYSLGVEAVLIMDDGCLIAGAGDGTIDILDAINWKGEFPKGKLLDPNLPYFRALKSTKINGCISSLVLMESDQRRGRDRLLLAGTRGSEIYAINLSTMSALLVLTCHRCAINCVAFPRGMSGVFATGGSGDVRVWCLDSCQELLRIVVPNFTCAAVLFAGDGKSIVSAWNDGCIRSFTPLTGRLIYCILNTHNKGTSALDMTSDAKTLISGGCEGQVRIWDIKPERQTLKKVLKEHKSPVSAIQVSPNDLEAVSAGTDGSCIIWNLESLSRRQVMYANTLFMCVRYEPRGCQLLTGGTDRRVAYWETGGGNLARELEASKVGAINGLDISSDGELFITGANDQLVKLWQYEAGIYTHVGAGHAGAVSCCAFSPDGTRAVSCCAAGTVLVWHVPQEYLPKETPASPQPVSSAKSLKSPKEMSEQLRLPLGEEASKAAGDVKKQPRLPHGPTKPAERIEAMDTARSSVHSCCPCERAAAAAAAAGNKTSPSPATSKPPSVKCCRPPASQNLPTKTTSKEFVNRGGGSGDKK